MKKAVLLLALVAASAASQANQAVEAFSQCISDNTTGKDRKALARWIFVSMGAHPEMRVIAPIPPAISEDTSRAAGELLSRLLADSCATQTKAAVRAVGPIAVQHAFTVLGQLAMQELMTDKDVAAGMASFQKHLDSKKLEPILNPR
jgi:hypothetical protein